MRERIAVAIFLILSVSCRKDRIGPGFDLLYEREFVIAAGLGPFVTHHFYFRDIPTRFQTLLRENGKTEADIQAVLTRQASLGGIFGDADFSVVEEASLRVYLESDPKGAIEAAYRFPTPIERSNTLELIPSLADLKRIVRNERFSLDLALRLRRNTPDEIPARITLTLRATYN
ncbi:MAG: hypothetical protein NZM43_01625 [Saprospiraceae bacterium]|nr:hypothetical protein [Saprospiraceae bacterium]MDW8483000.1 hypothetical protein [Saprospiraceae bacterium]